MLDESLLKSEFSYGGFRSYYTSKLLSKSQDREFSGGDKEFKELTSKIMHYGENNSNGYPCFGAYQNCLRTSGLSGRSDNGDTRSLERDDELYIVINTDRNRTTKLCQYCWMSVEELINHINIIKSLFEGFEFSVFSDEENKTMRVKFLFKKGEISLFRIRFLLTWMRYSYEWAISMATMDAYKILNHPELMPELSKENIFNLVEITNKLPIKYVLSDQVIQANGLPFEFNKFKEAVIRKDNINLNRDVYPRTVSSPKYLSSDIHDRSRLDIDKKYYLSLAWWEDIDVLINQRIPIYREYLKHFEQYGYRPKN